VNAFHKLPRLVCLEAIGAACILILMALNEYADLPKIAFGEEPTPLRHHEFLMESAAVCVVAAIVMAISWLADRRHRKLDALLVMCAWCRQVRVVDRWISIEAFLKEHDETTSTFGLCPSCYEKQAVHAAKS
jgi:hypothetical protein